MEVNRLDVMGAERTVTTGYIYIYKYEYSEVQDAIGRKLGQAGLHSQAAKQPSSQAMNVLGMEDGMSPAPLLRCTSKQTKDSRTYVRGISNW